MREHTDLLTLRAQLARAEKEARREAKAPPPPASLTLGSGAPKPLRPQREADLEGVETGEFSLGRAHARLRDLIYDARYHICPHATNHARAEGFLEQDVIGVLLSGRVRAIYPQERRWLVCGSFESGTVRLPLHVVVQLQGVQLRGGVAEALDIVTAFIPKHPYHVISRARLAVMLRWDDEQPSVRTAQPGNKVGYRGKGKWKKGA